MCCNWYAFAGIPNGTFGKTYFLLLDTNMTYLGLFHSNQVQSVALVQAEHWSNFLISWLTSAAFFILSCCTMQPFWPECYCYSTDWDPCQCCLLLLLFVFINWIVQQFEKYAYSLSCQEKCCPGSVSSESLLVVWQRNVTTVMKISKSPEGHCDCPRNSPENNLL